MNDVDSRKESAYCLRWTRLVVVLAAISCGALAVGFYPTWRWNGGAGLWAAVCAVLVDFLLLSASGALACWALRHFVPTKAMQVFLIAGLGRVVLLVLIGLTLCWLLNLPVVAYWLWAVSAYLPMLLAEVLWASSGLSRCRTKDAAASIPSAGSGPVEGRA